MMNTENEKIIAEAAQKLGEHFDHVQVLVTWEEQGVSKSCFKGAGNWYARQGLAHEFINSDIARDAAKEIAEQLRDKPDGSDDWKAA